jgi:hypothetical protein
MTSRRTASKSELHEVTMYWCNRPNCSGHAEEDSLIRFLEIFTPGQIKGAMHLATRKKQPDPFKYLCGILHNWRRELEAGRIPEYVDIGE